MDWGIIIEQQAKNIIGHDSITEVKLATNTRKFKQSSFWSNFASEKMNFASYFSKIL